MKDLISYRSVEEARTGDFSRLAIRLRHNVKLSDDERKFLADFLEGKVKPRRLKNGMTAADQELILQTVLFLGATDPNHSMESAVTHVSKRFKVSRSYVFKLLAKTDRERLEWAKGSAAALAHIGVKIKLVRKT